MKLKTLFKKWYIITLIIALLLGGISGGVWLHTLQPPDEDVAVNSNPEEPNQVTDESEKEPETIEELLNSSMGTVRIEAVNEDVAGVDINSKFKIYANKNIDSSILKSSISVTPEQSFAIDKVSESEYTLQFKEPLKPNSIYKFNIKSESQGINLSKAFQTRKEFRITATLPRDKATYVPINTGIEITFTHEGVDNMDDFFEITPAVKGTFEIHNKTVVFVPENLDYETIYTVTLKKGISLSNSSETIEEDCVFQFQTVRKKEAINDYDKYHTLSFQDRLYNFTSKEIPALSIYAHDYFNDKDLDVKLFQYESDKTFLEDLQKYDTSPAWVARSNEENLFDKSALQETVSFKGKIYDMGSPWYKQLIEFPSGVEPGYYLVSISYEDKEFMTHMQINDISTYIMIGKEKSLAWVNDSITGEPISGVEAKGQGITSGTSNEDGVVEFGLMDDDENKSSYHYITLSAQDRLPFIAFIRNNPYYYYMYGGNSGNTEVKYWSYLYLDRGMYLPTDTIQVWGVAKPRDNTRLEKVTVQIEKYTYNSYYESNYTELVSKEVEVSPYGAYNCPMEYENFNQGSYYLTVKVDDEILERRYFQVKKYTKPAYKINVDTDKRAYFLGEEVNIDVQSTFFEGSPVAGLNLNYRGYSYSSKGLQSLSGNTDCNNNGNASIKHKLETSVKDLEPVDWEPTYVNYRVNNGTAEEEEVSTYDSVMVFLRDIMIYGKGKMEQDKFVVELGTNKIDLTQLNNDDLSGYSMENYKGDTVDIQLEGKLIEKYWDKKEIGQYYDFVNKVTRKKYEYFRVENVLDEFQINTIDGQAVYEISYEDFSKQRSYYVEVKGNDQKNRAVKETIYLYQSFMYPSQLEKMEYDKNYSLSEDDKKYRFKTGEDINLNVLLNEEKFDIDDKGHVLYMILKNGLQSAHVVKDSEVNFKFIEEYIPNAYVKAIYFDGEKVHEVGTRILGYDYLEKELDIKIKPDRDFYEPGDTVNMDIEVTDKDGNPCEAEVNISVVDEAFFAMRDQYVNTIGDIYNYAFGTGVLMEYYSYKKHEEAHPGAECGEGGDEDDARYDFKDNAYFESVTTDQYGKGLIQFKLPDNITSWRVTYQGITEDLRAGDGRVNINARLPFFINLIFNDIYLSQDRPGISLRAFGSELNLGDVVNYKVVLEGPNNQQFKYEVETVAGNYCNIMLDSLEVGNYSITIYGESGELKDAVKKDFKVVENILETARTEYFTLTEDINISSLIDISNENTLTELVFYNKGIASYYRTLNSLYYSWGQRIDQVLSRKTAGYYLKEYFDRQYIDTDSIDLSGYQIHDGGIALLTYDSSNPVLTAKVCSVAKESFDEVDLKSYFYKKISDEKTTLEDVAACYWGLASFEEPVLLDIYAFLEREDISLEEKLYYGIALAEIGDDETAGKVYCEVLEEYGKFIDPYIYLEAETNRDVNIQLTSLCAVIGLKSNLPGHEGLFQYVMDNSSDEILTKLEKLIYVTSKTPNTNKEGVFSYSTNGDSKVISLNGLERYRTVMSSSALESIEFSDIKGDVELAVNYIGSVRDLVEHDQGVVELKRTYRVDGKETNTFTHSDVISIELTLEFSSGAPEGYYEITDVLPSGLKYIMPRPGQWKDYSWGSTNGQKITLGYYYSPKKKKSKTVKYLARVIATGEYTADSAVVIHSKSKAYGFTERSKITIMSAEE